MRAGFCGTQARTAGIHDSQKHFMLFSGSARFFRIAGRVSPNHLLEDHPFPAGRCYGLASAPAAARQEGARKQRQRSQTPSRAEFGNGQEHRARNQTGQTHY
jgi:hypothetical protein